MNRKCLFAHFPLYLCLLAGLALTSCATPDNEEQAREMKEFLYSPYLYISVPVQFGPRQHINPFLAQVKSLVGMPSGDFPEGVKAITLAFANGECGEESWGMGQKDDIDLQIGKLQRDHIDYVISTGGAGGIFTCGSQRGMEKFIARYTTRHLVGFDFDIESGQSEQVIANLVSQIKGAMKRYPHLRFSFTLASRSSSAQGQPSLNEHGRSVMKAIKQAGLNNYFINLMVMNFGEGKPENCVVASALCDMAESAIQVVNAFHLEYGVPLRRIEVTPMIGDNDSAGNVFTLTDARLLSRFVDTNALGGLHFWSLNRDGPCAPGIKGVSPVCHGLTGLDRMAFTSALAKPIP